MTPPAPPSFVNGGAGDTTPQGHQRGGIFRDSIERETIRGSFSDCACWFELCCVFLPQLDGFPLPADQD
eukprot:6203779-Pleurochrysis_carterae.AAC.6